MDITVLIVSEQDGKEVKLMVTDSTWDHIRKTQIGKNPYGFSLMQFDGVLVDDPDNLPYYRAIACDPVRYPDAILWKKVDPSTL